jgi:hypothetical protein
MSSPRTVRMERRRWLGGVLALVAVAVVALLVFTAVQVRNFVQGIGQQSGATTTDRSGPVILQSVRDLSRYQAASGSFQVIVDLEQDAAFIPSAIKGQRTLFIAVGTVDAFVDFSTLGDNAITVSSNRRSAEVHLPHAALDKPNLDHQRSYVYAQESGIVDRIQAFFASTPASQSQLYLIAERRIADAATQTGLQSRAEVNTRATLMGMLHTLGYDQVTVTFG